MLAQDVASDRNVQQGHPMHVGGAFFLHDMSVFRAPTAAAPVSLFLETKPAIDQRNVRNRQASPARSDSGDAAAGSAAGSADDGAGGAVVNDDASSNLAAGVYELKRQEARLVVE